MSVLQSTNRIYIAGHRGMVGSAVVRALLSAGVSDLLVRSKRELDLTCQNSVNEFFAEHRPEVVVFAAAKVGGIQANSRFPAEFLYQNLIMASNTVHAAWRNGTQRFLFLGSTCVYPRLAPQPMAESSLLTSSLEPTNEAYAIAKIAGLKLCQYYRHQYGVLFHSAMPTNLYGPGDNYHPDNSHVIPALIRRIHEAKESNAETVTIWGSGTPQREFLHVDDLASGILHMLQIEDPPDLVNIGSGDEISIRGVAELIADIVGFHGRIVSDPSMPDGTPRKLSDSSRIRSTGWVPQISLRMGLTAAYQGFLRQSKQKELQSV